MFPLASPHFPRSCAFYIEIIQKSDLSFSGEREYGAIGCRIDLEKMSNDRHPPLSCKQVLPVGFSAAVLPRIQSVGRMMSIAMYHTLNIRWCRRKVYCAHYRSLLSIDYHCVSIIIASISLQYTICSVLYAVHFLDEVIYCRYSGRILYSTRLMAYINLLSFEGHIDEAVPPPTPAA